MTDKFEDILYKYFSDIIYVDENPCIIYTRDISKSNGELTIKEKKDTYELTPILVDESTSNLFVPECKSGGILQKIKSNSNIIFFDFYPKNIIQRIFNQKRKNLISKLEELMKENDYEFVITNSDISPLLKSFDNVEVISHCDYLDFGVLEHMIVVGKKSKIILNKNIKTDDINPNMKNVDFWIDYDNFKVIKLS